MPVNRRIVHEGKAYYSVGATARVLSTTARKVREMMGRGDLEWTQLRINKRLLIPVESIVGYIKRRDGQPR